MGRRSGSSPYLVGQYMHMAATEDQGRWKLCDGRLMPIAQYPRLFLRLGTAFGGDGVTTFALPDLRSRVMGVIGQGVFSVTVDSTAVDTATETITVPANETLYTGTVVALSTTETAPGGLVAGNSYYVIRISATSIKLASSPTNAAAGTAINLTSQGTGSHTFTVTFTNRSLGDVAGEETHKLTTVEMPAHDHGIPHSQVGASGFTEWVIASGSGSTKTGSSGGGQAHNNMQPTVFASGVFIYVG